ncbi:MAG: hypothetical protein FWC62_04700 [Firmicutes bacterium]|nr:hypothetical protein [Bacillota bacterium]
MTMLEKLKTQRDALLAQMETGEIPVQPKHLWAYQELLYRIEVFEVMQMFHRSAPCTTDTKVLCGHYQMVDAYVHHITLERQYGKPADENQQKNRQAAIDSLQKVNEDYRRRFSSFRPSTAELYGKEIGNMIQCVLVAWLQYRNCYVDVNEIMKEAAK